MFKIANRENDERLVKLKEDGHTLYSFSKLSSIENCPYAAYLQYIYKEENQKENVWAILGNIIHDALEDITNKNMHCSELPDVLNNALNAIEILGIDFPKDINGGDSIKDNWIKSMNHFCNNFKGLQGEFITEELVIYHTEFDKYLMGYADLIKKNDDGTIDILDWKTSGIYKKQDIESHAHQLTVYAMALEQSGYKIRNISWVFLKYVEISFKGRKRLNSKEKTMITKVVERSKIGKELEKYFRDDMKELLLNDNEIDIIIDKIKTTSDLKYLPAEIRKNYNMKDYILSIPYNEEQKMNTKDFINNQIKEFERRNKSNPEEWEHRSFFKTSKSGRKSEDVFFCNNLCSFCNSCKYIKEFNDSQINKISRKDKHDKELNELLAMLS